MPLSLVEQLSIWDMGPFEGTTYVQAMHVCMMDQASAGWELQATPHRPHRCPPFNIYRYNQT